jgi:hypothetical protein
MIHAKNHTYGHSLPLHTKSDYLRRSNEKNSFLRIMIIEQQQHTSSRKLLPHSKVVCDRSLIYH